MSSREDVLTLLRGEGGFLSGQDLSRRLGLSRAAVWKAVDALRQEGYEIEARTRLGYRLSAAPDALTGRKSAAFWAAPPWWAGSSAASTSWTPPTTI